MMEQVLLRSGEIARRRLAGERWSEIAAALSVPEAKLKVYWGRVARGRSPEVIAAEARVAEAEARAADALAEMGAAEERGKALSAVTLAAAEDRAARAEAQAADLQGQLASAMASVGAYQTLVSTAQATITEIEAERDDLRREVATLSNDATADRKEIARLMTQVDMAKLRTADERAFADTVEAAAAAIENRMRAAEAEVGLTRPWLLAIAAAYTAKNWPAMNALMPTVVEWAQNQQ
jgi:chromosome segregation ATPase